MQWVPLDVDTSPHEPFPTTVDPGEMVEALGGFLAALQRPEWHAKAACRGKGSEAFFPARGESVEPARALCHRCPVQQECLAAGLAQPAWGDAGIWGGTSAKQRRQLRRSTDVDTAA